MNLDSDKILAFYVLVQKGSFQKASQFLGITQPALSQKIARLEDELEQTLILRRSKGLALTQVGSELVRYYKSKAELDNSFFEAISNQGIQSELRVGSYSSLTNSVLVPILAEINPTPRFNIITRELYELERLLVMGEVDFILTTNKIERHNLVCLEVAREKFVHIKPKSGSDSLPFIDHDEEDQTTLRFFEENPHKRPISRIFFDEINSVIKAVEFGLGQAIISEHLIKKKKEFKIIRKSGSLEIPVYLGFYQKTYYSQIQKIFIELIKKRIKKTLLD